MSEGTRAGAGEVVSGDPTEIFPEEQLGGRASN
jgi:hypothetical protein